MSHDAERRVVDPYTLVDDLGGDIANLKDAVEFLSRELYVLRVVHEADYLRRALERPVKRELAAAMRERLAVLDAAITGYGGR